MARRSLLAGLESRPATVVPTEHVAPRKATPNARGNRVLVPMWITQEARQEIKILALTMGKTQTDLLIEAANDLLSKYQKQRIA